LVLGSEGRIALRPGGTSRQLYAWTISVVREDASYQGTPSAVAAQAAVMTRRDESSGPGFSPLSLVDIILVIGHYIRAKPFQS